MNNHEALSKLAADLRSFAGKSNQHEQEHDKILEENAAILIHCFGGISNVIHTCFISSSTANAITNENFAILKDCLKSMIPTEGTDSKQSEQDNNNRVDRSESHKHFKDTSIGHTIVDEY